MNMRISHIGVHTLYYETHGLFSSTKFLINDKEKRNQVKVIILYKSAMVSDLFLFEPAIPKIGQSQVGQDQATSTYVQVVVQ